MDFMDENYTNDEEELEKSCRTLWVGNLHPKVTSDLITELFYQVGPIECVKFAIDEHEFCENFAWVIFKHSSSVEDSIKLFRGTKLFGLPIITKYYSKHLDEPVFHDQLDYFKQLVNVENNTLSNDGSNKSRWMDRSSNKMNNIPDSLPEPPVYNACVNANQDDLNSRSNMSRHSYDDKPSKYLHKPFTKSHNSAFRNEFKSDERSYHSRGRYQTSEHSSSSSMEVSSLSRDSYNHHNFDRKHRDAHSSSKWKKSSYHEPSFKNNNSPAKDVLPVRDLRDTMYHKQSLSGYQDDSNTNAACTSSLDLRDTLSHNKTKKYRDTGQFESDSYNQWSEKNHKIHSNSSFIDQESHKNINFPDRFNNSNSKPKSHSNRDYNNQSFNKDNSYDNFQEYDNANNYNNSHWLEKNKPANYKYNNMRSQNMETRNRQNSSYHPYKRNDEGYERKEYKNLYDERSGHNRGRSYNRGSDQSRQNYYS